MIDFENVSKNCEFRYQLLINNISDVMIEIDPDGTFTYLSPQVHDILGYYPKELVGTTLYDIINPVDSVLVKESIENFDESVESYSIDFQIKHKKTYYLYVSAKIAIANINGAKSIMILLRDITEKKVIEEKLKLSEAKYRDLYENAPNAYLSIGVDKKINRCNKRTEMLLNYTKKELSTMEVLDLYAHTKDGIIKAKNTFEKFLRGDIIQDEELRMQKKKGEHIWISLTVIPIRDKERNIIESRSMVIDITKRKIAEQKLKKNQDNLEFKIRERTIDLNKRIKELSCLYNISKLIEKELPIEIIIQRSLKIITEAFQFPEISCARINYENNEFKTENFNDTNWRLSDEILINKKVFLIEVYYFEDKPFLEEERSLLKEISIKLKNLLEKKQFQTELRASEHELKILYENAPVLMVLVDEERRVRKANNLATKFANQSEEEMLGLRGGEALRCLNAPNDPRGCGFSSECQLCNVHNTVLDTFKTGKSFHDIEARLPFLRDAKKKYLNLIVASVPVEIHGEKLALVTISDVSMLKETEQRLKESEKNYRNIINSTRDGISIIGLDGKFKFVSPQLSNMLGGREINLNTNIFEFVHPDEKNLIIELFSKGVKGKFAPTNEEIEFRAQHKNGHYIWLSSSTKNYYDDEGNMIGFISLLRDVSERMQAEQKLKESEEKYSTLFHYSNDAIIINDLEGNILEVNDRAIELFRYPKEEFLALKIQMLYTTEEQEKRETVSKEFSKKGFIRFEDNFKRKDGTGFPGEVSSRAIDMQGKKLIQAAIRDITDRKESEERLKIFMESAPNTFMLYDSDLNLIDINKIGIKRFPAGTKKEDIIGKNIVELSPDVKKKGRYDEYMEVIKTEKPFFVEEFIPHPKFGTLHFSLNAFKVLNGLGIIARDITERKLKEKELQLQSAIITNLSEGVHLIRVNDGTMVYTNPQFEEMFGYDPGEMIGENIAIVNAPTDKTPEETKEEIMRFLLETGEWHGEILNIKKDGTPFWCYANVSLFDHPEHGEVIVAVHTDITDRKKVEQEIMESEERYRSLFDNMLDGFALCKIITDENNNPVDFIYLEVNSSFEKLTGLKKEDTIGRKVTEIIPGVKQSNPEVFEIYGKVALTGESTKFEMFLDPLKIWLSISVYSIEKGYFVAAFDNITERKKAEEKVKELAKFPSENPNPVLRVNDHKVIYANTASQVQFNIQENDPLPEFLQEDVKNAIEKDTLIIIEVDFESQIFSFVINPVSEENYVNIYGRNITERKKAEIRIADSEKNLKNMLEAVPIGITITTPNGELLNFNSAAFKILGYSSREEFLNVPLINHYNDPKDRDKFVKLHEKGDIKEFECLFKRKDGTLMWGSLTSTAENIGKREVYINTFQDITERIKSAEEIIDMAKFPTENPYPVLRVTEEFVLFSNNAGQQLFNTKIGNRIPISLRDIVKKAFLKNIIHNIEVNFNGRDYSLSVTSIEGTNYANIYVLDITESKLVEKKLEEQYKFLTNVIEALTHPFFVINIDDYSVEMTNSSSRSVFGSDKTKCYSLHHNSKKPCKGNHICPLEEVKRTKKAVTTEHIHNDQEGNPRFFEVHGYPLFDKDGNIKQMIEYLLDITERKQVEEKVKQSEEMFRVMSQSAQDAIIQINHDGKITFWNKAAENIFQYTENDVLGKEMNLLIVPKRYRKAFSEGFKKFKDTGRGDVIGRTIELTALKKDGNEFPIEISISAVILKERWTSIAIIRDISKRKENNLKIKESEEKFRTLTEQSLLGIYILQENKIIYANQEISNLLGYSIEEIINWKPGKYMMLYQSVDKEWISQILGSDQRGVNNFIKHYECQCIRKTGEALWLENYLKLITFNGEPALMITSLNITEKKELDEIKSNLLTRFSHEFKTPLISIKGFTELLLTDYAEVFDKKMTSFLNRIKTGGNRLANLVNSFIESSKLNYKKEELNLSKGNLSNLIKTSVEQLEGHINTRNHTINMEIHDDLVLKYDEAKIYTVIDNLLLNAINYTPIGGKILIKSKLKKGSVLISIKDNGIGLSKKDKSHLFEPFGKIERYGKGWNIMTEGMGMGLHISKEFIELHKGKLWTESEGRNKGSTFIFSLPIVI